MRERGKGRKRNIVGKIDRDKIGEGKNRKRKNTREKINGIKSVSHGDGMKKCENWR